MIDGHWMGIDHPIYIYIYIYIITIIIIIIINESRHLKDGREFALAQTEGNTTKPTHRRKEEKENCGRQKERQQLRPTKNH